MIAETWAIVTGGGTGIGRALVAHLSRSHRVVACGRRLVPLIQSQRLADRPSAVSVVSCDIGEKDGRDLLIAALPREAHLALLVHNAAIGNPAQLGSIDIEHFEHSLRVNVVAPLAITQECLPALRRANGRVLHLGTGVAHNPQLGTATYGVTKKAFHRLFEQLNAEGVVCGSLSPGLVDTEGVQDHLTKARASQLPHVAYFDQAFEKGWTTSVSDLCEFVDYLLAMEPDKFGSQEWKFAEWSADRHSKAVMDDGREDGRGDPVARQQVVSNSKL